MGPNLLPGPQASWCKDGGSLLRRQLPWVLSSRALLSKPQACVASEVSFSMSALGVSLESGPFPLITALGSWSVFWWAVAEHDCALCTRGKVWRGGGKFSELPSTWRSKAVKMNIDIFKAVTKRSGYRRTRVLSVELVFRRRLQGKRNVSEHLVARWKRYSYVNLHSKSYSATHIVS